MATYGPQTQPLAKRSSLFGAWGIAGLAISVVVLIGGLVSIGQIVENLDAHELMVVQSPVSGELTVYTEPGIKYQGFGKVTKYPRRAEYGFSVRDMQPNGQPGPRDTSKRLRFNDGGHGNLYGAVSWEMPLKPEQIIKIHKTFGSADGVENQAVAKMIDAAVYLAGPLMSSTESSGERRAELVQYINDQAENGVYVTHARSIITRDQANVEKQTLVTEIIRDANGQPKRQQGSILGEFDIKLLPLSINELKYDRIVEDQIAQRQKATTEVQIAQANARKAQQDAITVEEQGKATAAKAKWDQETIKAKEVTKAEQEKQVAETQARQRYEVAKLDAQAAEQYKKEQILKGEGEGTRKRLVLEADGALEKKLEALVQMNKDQWTAISSYSGQWTPSVVMGGTMNAGNNNSANALIELLTAKTAKDLGVDLSVPQGNTTKKQEAKK